MPSDSYIVYSHKYDTFYCVISYNVNTHSCFCHDINIILHVPGNTILIVSDSFKLRTISIQMYIYGLWLKGSMVFLLMFGLFGLLDKLIKISFSTTKLPRTRQTSE